MFKKILLIMSLVISTTVLANPEVILLEDKNTVLFNDVYSTQFVSKKQIELFEKSAKLKEGEPIYLVLDTPGGSIVAGTTLIDSIKALPNPVHTITLHAASMGYNTVQALGTRYILPNGILMSHRATVKGISGEIGGELNSRVKFYVELTKKLDLIAANRTGLTLEQYEDLVADEYYVVGNDAVEAKQADKLAVVKCDKSLMGTVDREVRTLFGSFKVTFSKCPIVRGPLEVKGDRKLIPNLMKRYERLNILKK